MQTKSKNKPSEISYNLNQKIVETVSLFMMGVIIKVEIVDVLIKKEINKKENEVKDLHIYLLFKSIKKTDEELLSYYFHALTDMFNLEMSYQLSQEKYYIHAINLNEQIIDAACSPCYSVLTNKLINPEKEYSLKNQFSEKK